jgi:hypothetical protein
MWNLFCLTVQSHLHQILYVHMAHGFPPPICTGKRFIQDEHGKIVCSFFFQNFRVPLPWMGVPQPMKITGGPKGVNLRYEICRLQSRGLRPVTRNLGHFTLLIYIYYQSVTIGARGTKSI